jgi:hypothetical protein
MTISIAVDYKEFEPDTYKRVRIYDNKGNTSTVFDTGDFVVDFNSAIDKAIVLSKGTGEYVNFMSSVIDFMMDSEKYRWKRNDVSSCIVGVELDD